MCTSNVTLHWVCQLIILNIELCVIRLLEKRQWTGGALGIASVVCSHPGCELLYETAPAWLCLQMQGYQEKVECIVVHRIQSIGDL